MKDILKESKEFQLLFEKSSNLLAGRYSSKLRGEGTEFVDLNEYTLGDDVRKIDWKVTAKENKPFIKHFLEEKDASHYILFDISASMRNKLDFAKVLAVSLLISSSKFKDGFSICFFNSDEFKIFPLSKNKNDMMRYVYEISQVDVSSKGALESALIRFLSLVNKKSIVSIISDEIELSDRDISILRSVKFKHKLNYFHLYSSKEKDLHVGLNSFKDSESGESKVYDLSRSEVEEYKKEFDLQIKEVASKLSDIGVRPLELDCDLDLVGQISKSGGVI